MKSKKANQAKVNLTHPDAAGIDIGGAFHYVAIPSDRSEENVRKFDCFTSSLTEMAAWLKACGIKTIAMESTGVYWIPAYEILEANDFEVFLVNSRHVKNVPGRKSDVLDCQWIQQLHSYGLLRGSFRPEQEICELRAYMRQRDTLIKTASQHILHMQKALNQMNLQLANVVSDITGITGMKIIRAIVSGEHAPEKLAKCRDGRCKKSEEEIAKSLTGNFKKEHLFSLRQSLELFDVYQDKISDCDKEIESFLNAITTTQTTSSTDRKKRKRRNNELHFDAYATLMEIAGVDLTKVDGLTTNTALKIISEIGVNMDKWPTAKHFGSWLGLAPGTKISGGKSLSSKTKPCANRAAEALRLAASSLHHNYSALGACLRRQKIRLGAPKAITATAYKIAKIIYHMIKNQTEYSDIGQEVYNKQFQERSIKHIKRKAKEFGMQLVPIVNLEETNAMAP